MSKKTIAIIIIFSALAVFFAVYEKPATDQTIEQTANQENTVSENIPEQTTSPSPQASPTPTAPVKYKYVMTTLFWVGEAADESNNFITNKESYWDENWQEHFGGIDSPGSRCGYKPCAFEPKENPFYFALPYADENVKNSWIELIYTNKICYAQWEDVGPFGENDYDYVFGSSNPKNTLGVKAGLDVSPAVWDCLGMNENDIVGWKFVEEKNVPSGPWKETVTTSK